MPVLKRHKTKYAGVYFIVGTSTQGKPERVYYIRYHRGKKLVEEKAGRQFKDDMTPARASTLRAKKIGGEPSNKETRQREREAAERQAGRWTFNRLWEAYLKDKPDLKGLKSDKSRFETYIKPQFGTKEPREILPLDVDRLRLQNLKRKSPQTVKLTLALLRRLARFGAKKRFCPGFTFSLELPKVDNIKTEDLSRDQLQALQKAIEASEHKQAGALMLLALYTGMRRGEILKLAWKDVDLERGFIRIVSPKGGKSESIPINDGTKRVLLGLRGKSPFVFPGKKGDHRRDLHKATREIADAAGLPKSFRPLHGLRHVYASMLASSGKVDLYTLQKLLTHKSPAMTQRYAHLRDEALKRASDLAGEILAEAVNGATEA